jgi:uncharacterized repeat protein (TIGR02543 family)
MKKIVPVLFLAGILVLALALNLTVIAAPAPDDPETYANLLTAVQGEIDAAAFYGAAGLKALDDGYPTIAKLFFATADAEAKHADDLWAILDATGAKEKPTAKDPTIETTQENLQKAISAENYESEVMYPAFLSKAVLDREYDAATLFAYYKEAEKTHEGNFTDVRGMLLEDKEEEINSKYAVIYRCPKCGEIVLTRPDSCATCESSGAGYIAYNQTYANLYAAVHGETNAAAFYIASAAKALTDGYPVIAQLFQATADAEIKHAADEWKILESMGATEIPIAGTPVVGATLENLKQAFDGETYESEVMYPNFRTVAITESEADAAEIFNWAMQAEGVHAVNYLDVRMMLSAENVDGINSKYAKIYRCKVCGEVVTTLPANCPICGRPGSTFEVYELFTVEAAAGANGSITPSGNVLVPKGMSQTFTFSPASGFTVDKVTVDDEVLSPTPTSSYTFPNVSANHTINVTFKSSGGGGSSSGGGGGSVTNFTVTFDSNGGSAVASSTVAANTKVAKPADPTKEDFIFAGWFTVTDLATEYDFNTLVTKSFTLYAKWAEDEEEGGEEEDGFPFTDVPAASWFYEHVKYAYEFELMIGTGPTLFSPDLSVTRGMMVTVLYRMEGEPEVTKAASFSDVKPDIWYSDAVAWAEAYNIVEGYPYGIFLPEHNVSRQELATVLLRYAKFSGKDKLSAAFKPDDEVRDFVDADKIGPWAKEGVAFCVKNKIIEGRPDSSFNPTTFATRSEFAAMLHRFLENLK